jgi:hypothetical protein
VPIDFIKIINAIAAELILTNPLRRVEFTVSAKVMATGDGKLLCIALANRLQNTRKYTEKTVEAVIAWPGKGELARTSSGYRVDACVFCPAVSVLLPFTAKEKQP